MSSESRRRALQDLLRQFHQDPRFKTESEFLRNGIIPLFEVLGYSSGEMFFDYVVAWLNDFYRVDLAIGPNRHSHPWLLVEAKFPKTSDHFRRDLRVLTGLSEAARARAVVMITPRHLSMSTGGDSNLETHVRLDMRIEAAADDISQRLGRDVIANIGAPKTTPFFAVGAARRSGRFNIDPKGLEHRLQEACDAVEASKKGKTFEDLAGYLISALSCAEIRRRNLATATGELDLVCRLKPTNPPGLLGAADDGYFVVECKNWQDPVTSKDIEIFVGKLQKCRCRMGIVFSRNGITGKAGRDAVGNVEAIWRQHGIIILVITEETIRQVIEGYDFYSICERLYEEVRFSER